MEHEHGGASGAFGTLTQDADIALDLGLQRLAGDVGQRLDGTGLQHLGSGDLRAGTLVDPVGDLLRGRLVDGVQRAGDAGRCDTAQRGPGSEDHALGGVTRGDADTLGPGVLLRRGCLGRSVGDPGLRHRSLRALAGGLRGDLRLDHGDDGVHGPVTQLLDVQRRQVEVVLDPVLDAHTHQRVETQVDERQLTGQIVDVVPHGLGDDLLEAVGDRLTGRRIPAHGVRVDGRQGVGGGTGVLVPGSDGGRGGGLDRGRSGCRRRRRSAGGRGEGLTDEGGRPACRVAGDRVHLDVQSAEGALDDRGDLVTGTPGERTVGLGGADLCSGDHGGHRGLSQCGDRGDLGHRNGERGPAVRQGDLRTGHAADRAAGGSGLGPVVVQVPVHTRYLGVARGSGDSGAVRQLGEVDLRTADVELGDGGQQGVGAGLLALEQEHQGGLTGVVREGRVHHRHQCDRVRGELHEGAETGLELGGGGGLEPHRLTGAAHEVVGVVRGVPGTVDDALVDGGVQRGVDRVGFDGADLGMQFAEDRVEHAGVSGTLDLHLAGEASLLLEMGDQGVDLGGGATDGGHARRGVDRRLHIGELRVVGLELRELLDTEVDDGHRTELVLG